MTDEEALAEAKRLFGPDAELGVDDQACLDYVTVGVRDGDRFKLLGAGRTWEMALEAARRFRGLPDPA